MRSALISSLSMRIAVSLLVAGVPLALASACGGVPSGPNPDVLRSTVDLAKGHVARARNASENAVYPSREEQREAFIHAGDALARGEARDALDIVRVLLELQPANWMFHSLLVQTLYFGLHDAERALDAAGRCLHVDPLVIECLQVRALALLDLGRSTEARLALDTYIEVNPADERAQELLSRARLDSGDTEGAAALLRALVARSPDNLRRRLLLAHAEERSGRVDEAERQFMVVSRIHRDPVAGLTYLLRFYERQERSADVRAIRSEINRLQRPAPRRRLDPL